MKRSVCALVAIASSAFAAASRADLVTHALVAYGDTSLITVENFGTTHAAATSSYSSPGMFTGLAEGWADYGVVRARARADAQNLSFDTQLVQAEASFSDLLTLTGGTGQGFVVYQYTLTGFTVGDEHDAHAHAFLRHEGDPDEEIGEDLTGNTVLTSLTHGFTFGVPFSTGLLLSAEVHLHHGHSGTAIADFSGGALLTAVSVFDSQMNPIAQFSISSGSGTQYPLPAPGAALVLAAAGMVLPHRRRIRCG